MAYQTIGQNKGNSDSQGKLANLHLPPDLTGKSFLDLGCNVGFFCREARKRGARRTVGVDGKRKSIAEARQLDAEGEYLALDWFAALRTIREQFDIIIHLSAFHYVTDQWEFLKLVEQKLAPGGLFILECGTIKSNIPRYHYIRRTTFTKHVTTALLQQLLSPFEVKNMGSSADQSGDPVPRFVYHCRRRQPTALLLGGETASGKSYLGRALASGEQVGTIRMDELIPSLKHCPDPLIATLMQEYFGSGKGLEGVSHAILTAGLVKEFAVAVADLIPNCFNVVVIEGQIFTDGRIRQALANQLINRNFICWESERMMARESEVDETAGTSLLKPDKNITFHWQAANDKFVRPMPVDGEILLIVGDGKVVTSVAWSLPSAENQRFECSVRVHQRSKPVRFTFQAVDGSKVPPNATVFHQSVTAETSISEVVEGGDRYTRIGLDLPRTKGHTVLRLSIKMANARDPTATARVFIAAPRLIPQGGSSKVAVGMPATSKAAGTRWWSV